MKVYGAIDVTRCDVLQPELTVNNLPAYLAEHKPFVILFTPPNDAHDDAYQAVQNVVTSHQFSQLIFCYMNTCVPKQTDGMCLNTSNS